MGGNWNGGGMDGSEGMLRIKEGGISGDEYVFLYCKHY